MDVGGRTDLARGPGMIVAVQGARLASSADVKVAWLDCSSVTSAAAAVRTAAAATVRTAAAAATVSTAAAATMKTATGATVKTAADASLAAGRIGARHAAMIEAAEGAGMFATG